MRAGSQSFQAHFFKNQEEFKLVFIDNEKRHKKQVAFFSPWILPKFINFGLESSSLIWPVVQRLEMWTSVRRVSWYLNDTKPTMINYMRCIFYIFNYMSHEVYFQLKQIIVFLWWARGRGQLSHYIHYFQV